MKSKNLLDDPRTIYSLTMILILYEVYKSDIFTSENPLILIIKFGLIILISTQLIFLYLCGLSYAKLREEFIERLSEITSEIYEIGFQYSFFILFLNISFGVIYYYFKGYSYFFTPWGKILLIIITVLIAFGTIKIRKKYFELPDDNTFFHILIGFWVLIISLIILSNANL